MSTRPTSRELEVFAAYCRSGTQKVVAADLDVSYQTVKNHLTSLYARLEVGSALEAAVALGWLSVPGWTKPESVTDADARNVREHLRAALDLLDRAP